jgi:hypothetical protein
MELRLNRGETVCIRGDARGFGVRCGEGERPALAWNVPLGSSFDLKRRSQILKNGSRL